MDRRDFLLSSTAVLTFGFSSVGSAVTSANENTINGITLPEFGDQWDDEEISEEAYSFDWEGVRAEQAELGGTADEFASNAPSIASFLAIRATPTQMIQNDEEDTSSRITIGGGPVPFSVSVNNPMTILRENTCGENPYSETTTNFAQEVYTQQTRELHGYGGEPSIQDGLQKDWSISCIREFGYEKPQYRHFGFTFEVEWEAGDNDELENIDFRGLLSLESSGEEFLLVGGMVPDESVSTGLLGEEIVENESSLQSTLVSMMEETTLAEE
ncbi:hypothetical protein [Halobellus ordinarius]|uniref:hypothetical protein n=1 Tax=Halobellus ordinarius TaxID=3075120 RepID=UPI0028809B50|nr:hypothetical protein [Halobellus sp. ZY16]